MAKYSEDIVLEVINEYKNGKPLNHISKDRNIDYTTIKKWLKKYKVLENGTGRFCQKYECVGDYTKIHIKSNGGFIFALIDNEDVDRCKSVGIWSITKAGYVVNCKTGTYLHRFIMNCPKELEVDHVFHDQLDNRKSNLRISNSSQQKMNQKTRIDNKSGHRGVYFDKERNKWAAGIKKGNKRVFKRFDTYEDAVNFVEIEQEKMFKEFKYKEINKSTSK